MYSIRLKKERILRMTKDLEKKIDSLEKKMMVEQHWKDESRKGIEEILFDFVKEMVEERIVKKSIRLPIMLQTKDLLKEMLELYRVEEDGDLLEYLESFAAESIYTMFLFQNKEAKEALTVEEKAVEMLPYLQKKILKAAFENGQMKSSEDLVKEMKYLSQRQVCKLMTMAVRNYYINLNLMLKVGI